MSAGWRGLLELLIGLARPAPAVVLGTARAHDGLAASVRVQDGTAASVRAHDGLAASVRVSDAVEA